MRFKLNAKRLLISVLACFTATVNAQWNQIGSEIIGETGGDAAGKVLDMSTDGNTVIVGAENGMIPATFAGKTQVFSWNGSSWIQKGTTIYGVADTNYEGRDVSISSDGNTIATGAPNNDNANGVDAGQVRVYSWNGSAWVLKGAAIFGEGAAHYSGHSLSLSADGNRIVIGSDPTASITEDVRVFEWNGNAWVKMGSGIDGEATDDKFGTDVDISDNGSTIVVGAPYNDGSGANAGHVQVYTWNGSAWIQRGNDLDGEVAGDAKGWSVSINNDGTVVAIGAPYNDGIGSSAGHTRVFSWNGSAWVQKGVDLDGESASTWSGHSVALNDDGNTVAIGAPFNGLGHMRVYKWNGSTWAIEGGDIDSPNNSQGGWGVGINGDGTKVAMGVPNGGPSFHGEVRVYEPASPLLTQLRIADCGITLGTMTQWVHADPLAGATAYQFRFHEGGNPPLIKIRSDGQSKIRVSWVPGIQNSMTYDVEVRAKINGTWTSYGAMCQVTTPPIPLPQLTAPYCNSSQNVSTYIYCNSVVGADRYQFRFEEAGNPAVVLNKISTTQKTKPIWLTGIRNTTYNVTCRARVNGTWTNFGNACQLTISGAPMRPIIMAQRDGATENETIEELENQMSALLYPNPSNGQFKIELAVLPTEAYQVQVYNSLGQVVYAKQHTTQLVSIDLSGITKGIYFVKIANSRDSSTMKLLIQ
jgi:hypothetical protein